MRISAQIMRTYFVNINGKIHTLSEAGYYLAVDAGLIRAGDIVGRTNGIINKTSSFKSWKSFGFRPHPSTYVTIAELGDGRIAVAGGSKTNDVTGKLSVGSGIFGVESDGVRCVGVTGGIVGVCDKGWLTPPDTDFIGSDAEIFLSFSEPAQGAKAIEHLGGSTFRREFLPSKGGSYAKAAALRFLPGAWGEYAVLEKLSGGHPADPTGYVTGGRVAMGVVGINPRDPENGFMVMDDGAALLALSKWGLSGVAFQGLMLKSGSMSEFLTGALLKDIAALDSIASWSSKEDFALLAKGVLSGGNLSPGQADLIRRYEGFKSVISSKGPISGHEAVSILWNGE